MSYILSGVITLAMLGFLGLGYWYGSDNSCRVKAGIIYAAR